MSMRVSEKLRQHREACALSQRQIADALNIERSTYTRYETGDSEPNLSTIVKLARIFNVPVTELLPEYYSDEAVEQLGDNPRVNSNVYQLTKEERGLIARFRAMDRDNRQLALDMIANLSKNK